MGMDPIEHDCEKSSPFLDFRIVVHPGEAHLKIEKRGGRPGFLESRPT
jgi:hypothetical protein